MKKNFIYSTLILVVFAVLSGCKKDGALKQDEQASSPHTKKVANSYLDVVYISNSGFTTVDNGWQGYDNIKIYHTNLNNNIIVRYSATNAAGNQEHCGPGIVNLGSNEAVYFSLDNLFYLVPSRHSITGFYNDTFHFTITEVTDVNGVDITSQVLIIPLNGVDASTRASYVHPPDTGGGKDGEGEGH